MEKLRLIRSWKTLLLLFCMSLFSASIFAQGGQTLRGKVVDQSGEPLIGAKTIQLVIMREVLDYTVLRTEDTRELNTVATPLSVTDHTDTLRVAFLGPKR